MSQVSSAPSSTASPTAPTAWRATAAAKSTKMNVTKCLPIASASERLRELLHGGVEQDDEHRREHQKHEREQHLHRGLVSALLGVLTTALARLCRQVPHYCSHRDPERLALDDGANKGAHRRRLAALQHVSERDIRGQAHLLLLEHEPKL